MRRNILLTALLVATLGALGIASAATGSKKAPEPVFKQAPENHVYGPGSICFIPSPDGKEWYMLYHARKSLYDMLVLDSRTPRMQKIEWDKEGIPVLGIPQKEGFPLRKPSGTPERK